VPEGAFAHLFLHKSMKNTPRERERGRERKKKTFESGNAETHTYIEFTLRCVFAIQIVRPPSKIASLLVSDPPEIALLVWSPALLSGLLTDSQKQHARQIAALLATAKCLEHQCEEQASRS
jgi:hypothetical protein